MDGRRLGRAVLGGFAAAAVWGVASAAVTRVLMRGITLTVGGTPGFSWVGTLGIAFVYVLALLPGAVALACSSRRWPVLLLGAGAAFLLFQAVAIGTQETVAAADLTTAEWAGLAALLAAMALTYAAQFVLVYRTAREISVPSGAHAVAARPAA